MEKFFTVLLIFCFAYLLPIDSFCQTFEKEVLIDLPGDNYDYDLLFEDAFPGSTAFITWINKNDSVYTVYLKQISPVINNSNIIISSGTAVKSNPKVALNRYSQGIKIIWQNYSDSLYKVSCRNYLNDSLGRETVILDSLVSDPQITLSIHRIAWIENNDLYVKDFYPSIGSPKLIDTSTCSAPAILKEDSPNGTYIYYEKVIDNENNMFWAEYNRSIFPNWKTNRLSDGNNRNADIGIYNGVSFEKIINGISKIIFTYCGLSMMVSTNNLTCSYKNPNFFSYPMTTGAEEEDTPYFLTFDTDSLNDNNEIFILTFDYGIMDSLINISNMAGNDFCPKSAFISNNNISYVAIIWQHRENSKTDIWMAKHIFNPISNSVKNESQIVDKFNLEQNYPNPFNPTTSIEFKIDEAMEIKITVYDLLGNDIKTLVNGYKPAGSHSITFNANNLPSGVYFYTLFANGKMETKSMVLMK